jgi:hypothetical protein
VLSPARGQVNFHTQTIARSNCGVHEKNENPSLQNASTTCHDPRNLGPVANTEPQRHFHHLVVGWER